jgi:predicted AAA+ superfamily ATPase
MISRPTILAQIRQALRRSRVVALLGPRQSGKTTLARLIVPADSANYFDLEDPASLARLTEPVTALASLRGVVVIDEIQRRPDLFPVLRVLADRAPLPARFLVLGSASPALLRQSSESLAGRLETITLSGFSLAEAGAKALERHWLRGGFPLAFLARSDSDSLLWRRQFIQACLERDLPQLGVSLPAPALLRFWTMLAHYHGQTWRAAEPARSLGVSEPTVRRYLDLLTGLFMVRQLPPWHENLQKRQVKAPKVYVRDTGLLHQLLGLRTGQELVAHPKCGASWEGYAIEETLKLLQPDEAYFWATHNGAELDLLLFTRGRRLGVEVKRADAPTLTPSMRIALTDLRLDHLTVLYPGTKPYSLADRVSVVPLAMLAEGRIGTLFPTHGGGRMPRKGARP